MADDVFVFISNDPAEKGFSLSRAGGDLPSPQDGLGWLPIAVTELNRENLARHTLEPDVAMRALRTHGFHVARNSADILPFRRPALATGD